MNKDFLAGAVMAMLLFVSGLSIGSVRAENNQCYSFADYQRAIGGSHQGLNLPVKTKEGG